jgi:hypothetical protein
MACLEHPLAVVADPAFLFSSLALAGRNKLGDAHPGWADMFLFNDNRNTHHEGRRC